MAVTANLGPLQLRVLDQSARVVELQCFRCPVLGTIEDYLADGSRDLLCRWCYIEDQKVWAERIFANYYRGAKTVEDVDNTLTQLGLF